jgi:hypothetical protein
MQRTTSRLIHAACVGVLSLAAWLPESRADLTWQTVSIPGVSTSTHLTHVWARNTKEVYVWGADNANPTPNATLYRWDGTDWGVVLTVAGQWPASVFGVGTSEVFAASDTKMWRSTDNGATWTLEATPLAGTLRFRSIRGTANNVQAIGLDVNNGDNGYILRFDGTSWTTRFSTLAAGISGSAPNAQSHVSPGESYFVSCWNWGRWDGADWSVVDQGFSFCDVYDTYALRDAQGRLHWWAVGNNGGSNGIRIWCFDTNTMSFGGHQGYCFAEGNGSNIGSASGIWASGPDDVYVIGTLGTVSGGPRAGRVYHFDGIQWSRLTDVGDIIPRGVWGTSSEDVWLVGSNGRVLHRTAPADPLSFADSFEGPPNTSFWSTSAQSGSVALPSSTRAHSGTRSAELISTESGLDKWVHLYHQFRTPTYGTVSVWVYDTGADVASANMITFSVSGGGPVVARIYTADYDLGPGRDGSTYVCGAIGAPPEDIRTAVDRTQGWHKWTITVLPDSITLAIGDGLSDTVVYRGPGGHKFDRVDMMLSGPFWRPARAVQFDDFAFLAAPALNVRASQVELCWESAENIIYQVQYKEAAGAGDWRSLGSPLTGTGARMCVQDPIGAAQPKRVYRVIASQ